MAYGKLLIKTVNKIFVYYAKKREIEKNFSLFVYFTDCTMITILFFKIIVYDINVEVIHIGKMILEKGKVCHR